MLKKLIKKAGLMSVSTHEAFRIDASQRLMRSQDVVRDVSAERARLSERLENAKRELEELVGVREKMTKVRGRLQEECELTTSLKVRLKKANRTIAALSVAIYLMVFIVAATVMTIVSMVAEGGRLS